jgi:hypothetical protein
MNGRSLLYAHVSQYTMVKLGRQEGRASEEIAITFNLATFTFQPYPPIAYAPDSIH